MKLSTILIYAILLYLAIHICTLPLAIVTIVLTICLLVILITIFQKHPYVSVILNTLKTLF